MHSHYREFHPSTIVPTYRAGGVNIGQRAEGKAKNLGIGELRNSGILVFNSLGLYEATDTKVEIWGNEGFIAWRIGHSAKRKEQTLGEGMVLVRNCYSLISAGTEGSTVEAARKGYIGKTKERPQQVKQVI